jgi:hypothetical protein
LPRGRELWIAVAVAVGAIAVIAVVAYGTDNTAANHTSSPASAASAGRAGGTSTGRATTGPTGDSSTGGTTSTSGNSGNSGSGSNSEASWVATNRSVLNALQFDFSAISGDAKNVNLQALRGACHQLHTDTATAQSLPPIPDSRLEKDWSTALTDYGSAATACTDGMDQNSSGLIDQAVSDIQDGNQALGDIVGG